MIPANFEYHRATSVSEAINLLVEHGMDAKILAGGHSLIPAMKLRLNQPGLLIDIARISELRGIRNRWGRSRHWCGYHPPGIDFFRIDSQVLVYDLGGR